MKKAFILLTIIFVFSATLLYLNPLILTKNHPVQSRILIIEGWLAAHELEIIQQSDFVKNADTIYVSGIRLQFDTFHIKKVSFPCKLFSNGSIYLNIENKEAGKSNLKIYAHGTYGQGVKPEMMVYHENKMIGSIFVSKHSQKYLFTDSLFAGKNKISIAFINDAYFKKEDRNLIIDSVEVNGLKVDYADVLQEFMTNIEKYSVYPYPSNAEKTAAYLKSLDIKCPIIVVDTLFTSRNKTLASAKKMASYFRNKKYTSFNVVSVHGHSRRTYLAYKAAFPNAQVGIISIDNRAYRMDGSIVKRIYHIADEYVSTLVTSAIFLYSTPLK